jgi:uncharacterized membrane protein (UPF0127 family)
MDIPLKKGLFFVLVILAILVAAFLVYGYYPMAPAETPQPLTQVWIGADGASSPQATVQVEVESTEAAREQGLSGRTSLPAGRGMLFVFQTPGMYGFWMKDMNFALDMLFADASGKIVTIVKDATPESYLQNPPQVFYPKSPILYVLEVPAGFADAHTIQEGMVLQVK